MDALFFCMKITHTRHDGSLSTGHANSPADMLSRLETLVLMGMDIPLAAVRQQIATAIDIIVHLGRLRDRSRKVLEICEVGQVKNGSIMLYPLFQFVEEGEFSGKVKGKLQDTGQKLKNRDKCERAGIQI